MPHIFIVATPFQYLSALEAVRHYGVSTVTEGVLFIDGRHHWSVQSILDLAQDTEWKQVHVEVHRNGWFGASTRLAGLRRISRLNRFADQFETVDCCYTAMFVDPMIRHLTNRLAPQELVLLDEGIGQLHLITEYNQRCDHKMTTGGLRRRWYGYDPSARSDYSAFSAYQLGEVPADRIVVHNFDFVRTRYLTADAQLTGSRALFVGWPARSQISEAVYVDVLQQAFNQLQSYCDDILYVAHKTNSGSMLRMIESSPGVKVTSFDRPVELEVLAFQRIPAVIAGFATSALENLRLLLSSSPIRFVSFEASKASLPFFSDGDDVAAASYREYWERNSRIYDYLRSIPDPRLEVVVLSPDSVSGDSNAAR